MPNSTCKMQHSIPQDVCAFVPADKKVHDKMNEVQRKIKEQLDCQHQEHLCQVTPLPFLPHRVPHAHAILPAGMVQLTTTSSTWFSL